MKLMFTHDQGKLAALKLLPRLPDRHGQLQKMVIRESVTACLPLERLSSSGFSVSIVTFKYSINFQFQVTITLALRAER